MKTRQCVYISHDVHALIAKLVRVLAMAGKEVTVGGYIDTVLSEHLQANKDEINEIYRQSCTVKTHWLRLALPSREERTPLVFLRT